MKIGVVGQGYVGLAIKEGFENHYPIFSYDKFDKSKSNVSSIKDLVKESDIIFVCVPTPMDAKTGKCYTGIVHEVCEELNNFANEDMVIILKSTIPPGTTDMLNKKYKNLNLLFNPEFLTEANFLEDFKNQNRIILGGNEAGTNVLQEIYSTVFPKAEIIKTESTIAEMIKYMTNAYLATKVSFANEIKQICDQLNIEYNVVMKYATIDSRLGSTHWEVPGPDGEFGFGGHCLPKDLNGLIYVAKQHSLDVDVLKSVLKTNDKVRVSRDWEDMVGRAIIDE